MSFLFETIPPFALDEKRHRIHQQHNRYLLLYLGPYTICLSEYSAVQKLVGAHYWTDSILRCQLNDDGLDEMMDRI